MTAKKLERFGRYLLLDHILDGGMNRIFRARYLGDTASKICAIKVVLPQYSKDPAFKTMFMDEIKVTFGLLHPNIVQTYDYGTQNGQLYVAMEYCDGRNLKEYLDKLKERKFVFPVEISVYIATQVCQGLHYAHTLTDKLSGKEINIIHRDISPHNIMLTYDGAIKVIDFGIAKAETNSEATQAGTIKGKLSYLAPEYLDGKDLDVRYDQFAVGITLWEMLCSKKLFRAANDIAVLKKIQECNVPAPSSINPNVPEELDEIILKSLSKDREDRYENLDQMNRALIKFLYSTYPDFNATDLAYFAKELFKEEIKKDRDKLFEFGQIDINPYIEDMKSDNSEGRTSGEVGSTPVVESGNSSDSVTKNLKMHEFDFGFEEAGKVEKTKAGTRILNKKRVNKALARKKGVSNEEGREKKEKEQSDSDELKIDLPSSPKKSRSATLEVDRTSVGIKRDTTLIKKSVGTVSNKNIKREKPATKNKMIGIVAGAAAIAAIAFIGNENLNKGNDDTKERGPSSIERKAKAIKKFGKVLLKNFDTFKQKAFVDGKEVEVSVLGVIKDVQVGGHVLRIEQSGHEHFIKKIKITENKAFVVEISDMPEAKYGYLVTSGNCVGGTLHLKVFNESRVENLPITSSNGIGFPLEMDKGGEVVPTNFTVYLRKEGEDIERALSFQILRENDFIDLCDKI